MDLVERFKQIKLERVEAFEEHQRLNGGDSLSSLLSYESQGGFMGTELQIRKKVLLAEKENFERIAKTGCKRTYGVTINIGTPKKSSYAY